MILKGKPVADRMKAQIEEKVKEYQNQGLIPTLAILRVGEREDDISYESRVVKNCASVGIQVRLVTVDGNVDMVNFMEILEELNRDDNIHGILIFRPLPNQLDEAAVCQAINPSKDVDCMSPVNTGKVFVGDRDGFSPCTPEAVIEILKYYDYDLTGKNVVIVNRSMVLGRPLAMLFLAENATVTICHSKTKNINKIMANADIVITGIGKPMYYGMDSFSKDSIVVDVGINFKDGKMCGDVNFEEVENQIAAITPVPGGVGIVTSMILLNHVMKGIELQK